MKRWRCPHCGAVHTMRPVTHWRGFWADRLIILFALVRKEAGGQWLCGISRQRQQYWWAGLRKQRLYAGSPLSVVELISEGVIGATHSFTYRETVPYRYPPHRIFAVTPRARAP